MSYKTSDSFATFATSTVLEIQYLERQVKEQQEIIEQLTGTGKPKGYVYMHPLDVADLFQKIKYMDVIPNVRKLNDDGLIHANGRVIKQSPWIPPVTQQIV